MSSQTTWPETSHKVYGAAQIVFSYQGHKVRLIGSDASKDHVELTGAPDNRARRLVVWLEEPDLESTR